MAKAPHADFAGGAGAGAAGVRGWLTIDGVGGGGTIVGGARIVGLYDKEIGAGLPPPPEMGGGLAHGSAFSGFYIHSSLVVYHGGRREGSMGLTEDDEGGEDGVGAVGTAQSAA